MSDRNIRILVVDDDPLSLELVEAALEQPGVDIHKEFDPRTALSLTRRLRPDIVLVDLMMPGMTGMELLEKILELDPAIEVILMTAHYSTESAVEAIQKGAADYFNKPISIERLQERVGRMVADIRQQRKARQIGGQMIETCQFAGMIGRGPAMLELFARIRRVAPHYRTALITGATGTGKELVARALHKMSPVETGPFVVCNAAALPEALLESELFGHTRGAFTGAVQDRQGLFQAAHKGTLFLDEIGEMPLAAQAKLLRAVQQQEVQRLGSSVAEKVNVRIVAATNRDLAASVAHKEFREDLFFRLAMVHLQIPALAERREDIPLLIQHFVESWSRQYNKEVEGLDRRVEKLLMRHHWPGNVRELENTIGYAAMMAQGPRIELADLPDSLQAPAGAEKTPGSGYPFVSLDEMRARHARDLVESLAGDKDRAAEVLGVSRATLYRLLAEQTASQP